MLGLTADAAAAAQHNVWRGVKSSSLEPHSVVVLLLLVPQGAVVMAGDGDRAGGCVCERARLTSQPLTQHSLFTKKREWDMIIMMKMCMWCCWSVTRFRYWKCARHTILARNAIIRGGKCHGRRLLEGDFGLGDDCVLQLLPGSRLLWQTFARESIMCCNFCQGDDFCGNFLPGKTIATITTVTCPGPQALASAPTLWELTPIIQQRWSHLTGPRSQASCSNMMHSKCWMLWGWVDICDIVYYSMACAIPDPDTDTVVVTGGYNDLNTVVVYSVQGYKKDLPSLSIGRYRHACSSYVTGGKRVS